MTEQSISEKIMSEQMSEQSETESVKESRGGWIYKIVFPNGKHYIGLTTQSIEKRKKQHRNAAKRGDTKCLYKAIRKYNMVDSFELMEIDTADSFDELCELEKHYIEEYNSYYLDGGNGYNMTFGGASPYGYIFTEDVKLRMSEIKKRYFEDHPEAGTEYGEKMKRYFEEHPEVCKEHSERMKLYYDDPKARQAMSERRKRYFEDPKARQAMSERSKRYFDTHPEAGKKHSERMKMYYDEHPEARQAISEKLKGYYEDKPEARQARSERMKKSFENLEVKKKFLDARGCNKPFDVFKLDGTYIETFTYIFEAKQYLQKEYGVTPYVSSVLIGTAKSSHGFTFKYSGDPLDRKNVNFDIENKKKRLDAKGKNKPFMVFKCDDKSLVGEFTYEFEAREFLKKEYGNVPKIEGVEISIVLTGQRKSSKGFTFKYKKPRTTTSPQIANNLPHIANPNPTPHN